LYIVSKFDNYPKNQNHEYSELNKKDREKMELIKVID
jgi:hypothetical protein